MADENGSITYPQPEIDRMQSIRSRTKPNFPISIACCKTPRSLDPPTEAGGLTYPGGMLFRRSHPAVHILPLRLRAVKGRKLFPLTVLASAAHGVQRDGSDGSRPATRMSNQSVSRSALIGVSKNRFQIKHKLHFLHRQGLEEVDEAYYEFESAS